MGVSHSQDRAALFDAGAPWDGDQVDIARYIWRFESRLWRVAPPWAPILGGKEDREEAAASPRSSQRAAGIVIDPWKKLTKQEAFELLPTMLSDSWVSPLVAFIDSTEGVVQSAALALLAKVLIKDSAVEIFYSVGGMDKVMSLLTQKGELVAVYLALQVVYSLCEISAKMVERLCEAGLIQYIYNLARSDSPELIKLSLKILSMTLRLDSVKDALHACGLLPVLVSLVESANVDIARAAVICIGQSLPNAKNLAEILRLGCIELFLKAMTPANRNVDAVIFTLSLIADESDAQFPRDLTLTATTRMLETLRGAAKRSKAASAMGFLCASLAKSSVFHTAICTEQNLSILSKLLVGGSNDVLCAAAFALGVVAIHGNDRVKHTLIVVEAPQNLIQLVVAPPQPSSSSSSSSSSTPSLSDYDTIIRCAVFALGAVTVEGAVLASGTQVYPALTYADSLHRDLVGFCGALLGSNAIRLLYEMAIAPHQQISSSYALKLLTTVSATDAVKRQLCTLESVKQLIFYLKCASSEFLGCVLMLLIECCTSGVSESTNSYGDTQETQLRATDTGVALCKTIEQTDDALEAVSVVFREHQPANLLGLADLLSLFVLNSPVLKARLSTRDLIDNTLAVASRVHHSVLHAQVVTFLGHLTADKNQVAVSALFEAGPDRVVNLLQASADVHVQITAATVLRRVFKRLNGLDAPAAPALRHLSRLLSKGVTDSEVDIAATTRDVALAACRVWGNLVQYEDKRRAFAKSAEPVDGVLLLLNACIPKAGSGSEAAQDTLSGDKPVERRAKQLFWVLRTIHRAVQSDEVKQVLVTSPRFFGIVDAFMHPCESIVRLSISSVTEIAKSPALRKLVMVPAVLDTVLQILRDRESSPARVACKIYSLRFLAIVARKDPVIQQILAESKILEATLVLLHSPMTSLSADILKESMDTLAWMSSGHAPPCRRLVATAKVVDFALRNVDSAREDVALASLHLLQRLSQEDQVKGFVFNVNGGSVVMRALQRRIETETKRRACALIRNLVAQHDENRKQFQALGASNFLVALVTSATDEQNVREKADEAFLLRLQATGLEAIGALCASTTAAGKTCKREVVESEHSAKLLAMVDVSTDKKLVAVWSYALAMAVHGSTMNQKYLVDAGLVPLLVQLLRAGAKQQHRDSHLVAHNQRAQINTVQLMTYLAVLPDNRSRIVKDGGEDLLGAVVAGLQSDMHDLNRYAALLVANLATRNVDNKVKLGVSGVISPLTDRLSSKQLNVLENMLNAISKLGSHAGNKVKVGSKVCFEKLLALIHHDELAIRKNAVAAVAVLIEGNDSNKKFLLQCEAAVALEICALMKSTNGKIVESAMLILGELSLLPDQTLEISKFIDIVAVVRMLEHLNAKIRRAALCTVLNLTKESFNKIRFGIKECIDALIACLVSDDLIIVELAITCLGNLSFTPANASLIAQHASSLVLLLKLAAASTTSKDYLSWNESRMLRLAKSPSKGGTGGSTSNNGSYPYPARIQDEGEVNYSVAEDTLQEMLDPQGDDDRTLMYSYRKMDEVNEEEDQQGEVLDFGSFPSRQTAVLEQTLLILSNCAEEYYQRQMVEKVAIKVVCQALHHNSELVKRCACYTLACWCKKYVKNQETATRRGVLPTLVQLLNAPSLHIVEAAMYALAKLCYFGDNHVKMLNLDILATLVQGTLRRQSNMTQPSLLDRAIRLLGTLVQFAKVRQVIKSEEVIADVLTQVLQLHRTVLAKNVSRLLLAMLLEDSLKFFMPKKTVMLLRGIYTDHDASLKTVRNVLLIFELIASVEEHKSTIALEDSSETLTQMVAGLDVECEQHEDLLRIPEFPPNARTIISTLAILAGSRKIALILHEKHVYAALPQYLVPFSPSVIERKETDMEKEGEGAASDPNVAAERAKRVEMNLNAVHVANHMCKFLDERALRQLSALEISRLLVNLLRAEHQKAQECPDDSTSRLLSLLACECLAILHQLCANPDDEHIMFQEGAVELFLRYLALWHRAALLNQSDADDSVPTDSDAGMQHVVSPKSFIRPLATALLGMARGQFQNRQAFVEAEGIPLVMAALSVPFLTDAVREELIETLSYISPIPIASGIYDKQDTVSPLIKFMIQHRERPHLLLLSLQVLVDMVEMSQSSRKHVVTGGTQGLVFLVDCLLSSPKLDQAINDRRLRYAITALECISTEQDVAQVLATLPNLPQVHQLLLLPATGEQRDIQLFATEMIGYMTFFGYADKLKLTSAVVDKVIKFCDFEQDEAATVESISLCVWTLAMLVKTPSETAPPLAERVCQWILNPPNGIDVLLNCGFFAPEHLAMPSAVVGHVLSILMAAVRAHANLPSALARKPSICTALAAQLEAVEPDIRLPALRMLAIILPKCAVGEDSSKERWSIILNHLMEWMQVYVQDPGTCPTASILDAYTALSFLTTHPSVEPDFKGPVARSRLIDTVANTLLFFGAKKLPSRPESMLLLRHESGPSGASNEADQARVGWEQQFGVLLNALRVLNNLTRFAERYTTRVLQLHVPPVIENLLHLRDSRILAETLRCMNHLATFSSDNSLLFSSDQCITQLKSLLQSEKPGLLALITPLLALMANDMPTLPGLCSIDGVNIISDLVGMSASWDNRDDNERRVTDDCCAILLALFAANEQIFVNYDIAQVIPKLFCIVERNDIPVLPLRVLVRISVCPDSHLRFLKLLPRMCLLLSTNSSSDREGVKQALSRLSSESMMLLLTILFNIYCRLASTDASKMVPVLRAGEATLLPRLLPLHRWVEVERIQHQTVRMVVKILHVYLASEPFKTLLNDGLNILSMLALVGAESEEVAVAAAELLLLASAEKDVQISIVVEDGIASLTRTLCSATGWQLQCLVLKLLASMSSDTEVQALLLAAHGGVERIVEFTNTRKGVMLSADERLGMSCEVLMHLSRSPTGPQRIIEASGHTSVLELSAGQISVKGDEHRVVTMQILANLAAAATKVSVSTAALVAAKLPDHFAKYVLHGRSSSAPRASVAMCTSEKLALAGIRALSRASGDVRNELSKNAALVSLLEMLLLPEVTELPIMLDALATLYALSKLSAGCLAVAKNASSSVISRVCSAICRVRNNDPKQDASKTTPEASTSTFLGVKLLANLLSDVSTLQVAWDLASLASLSALLGTILKNHEQPKRQLTVLKILSGAFARRSYFYLSSDMLVDLLNILLISASQQHRVLAERILVLAFQDDAKIRPSIVGCQILEQLVIVFAQQSEPIEQRVLAPALVLVFHEAIAREILVSQRFLHKLVSLLGSFTSSTSAGEDIAVASGPGAMSAHEASLENALCAYLCFAYGYKSAELRISSPVPVQTPLRSSIRDVVRADNNASALLVLVRQLGYLHARICATTARSGVHSPSKAPRPPDNVLLWNCVVDSISPVEAHVKRALEECMPAPTWWMCLVLDWFSWLQADAIDAPTKITTPSDSTARDDAVVNICRMVSVMTTMFSRTASGQGDKTALDASAAPDAGSQAEKTVSEMQSRLCSVCISTLWLHVPENVTVESLRLIESALQALLDARNAWGDDIILSGCDTNAFTAELLAKLLQIFHIADRAMDRPRRLLLQLLLLLVSSGRFMEELKAAKIRDVIETNKYIATSDKALPVTILGLLGYNADLNDELRKALARLYDAENDTQRQEQIKYIDNFLQLYSVTDDETLEYAVNVFMRLLTSSVAAAVVAATVDAAGETGEAVTIATTKAMVLAYLAVLRRLTVARKFAKLYLKKWGLSVLLGVVFARIRGQVINGYQESSLFDVSDISETLQAIVCPIRDQIDSDLLRTSSPTSDPLGDLDLQTLHSLSATVAQPIDAVANEVKAAFVERVLVLLDWMMRRSARCFGDIYDYAVRLRVFFPFVAWWLADSRNPQSSKAVGGWLSVLDRIVNHIPGQTERLDELLLSLLAFIYDNVANMSAQVRDRLLLYVLATLKRMGEQGRAGSASFEHAIEQILAHVNHPNATELQTRCSYDLLGVLTQLDPAITVLFNMNGDQILLQECGCGANSSLSTPGSPVTPSSRHPTDSWRSTKRAVAYCQTEALKCLSRAAHTHDEVLMKVGEAAGIASFLFRALSKGLEPQAGGSGGTSSSHSTRVTPLGTASGALGALAAHNRHESTQEHAALLIARIASQEYIRAALLSQENVSILIESLESVHLAVVLASLEALRYLCDFSMCLDALVRYATVPVLAQILFSSAPSTDDQQAVDSIRSVSCVMRLLAEMCAKSKMVCRRVVSSHLVPKLKEYLKVVTQPASSPRSPAKIKMGADLRHDTVWVIKSISKDTELVLKVIDQGVIEALCGQFAGFDPVATQPKAMSALRNLVAVSGALENASLGQVIQTTAAVIRKNIPVPSYQRAVAKGLSVFVVIAGLQSHEAYQTSKQQVTQQQQWPVLSVPKQLLMDGKAVQLALDLLKSHDPMVKLQAFTVVFTFAEGLSDLALVRELVTSEASTTTGTKTVSPPLTAIVRAVSDESRIATTASSSALLLVALMLLNVLLSDDALKAKLTPMAYQVVLQVVIVITAPTSSSQLNAHQHKLLTEALTALAVMTKADGTGGGDSATSSTSPVYKSLEPLVRLVHAGSGSIRLNALFLLVNFASSPDLRARIWSLGGLEVLVDVLVAAAADDKVVQLCLLGIALLTSSEDWSSTVGSESSTVVNQLAGAVDTLIALLRAKNASVQANAVWVVSNLSTVARLKDAIVARGGATTLQSMLNESLLSDTLPLAAAGGTGISTATTATTAVRPTSSSLRIREYAPKAIKSLGFVPITPSTAAASPPPPPPRSTLKPNV